MELALEQQKKLNRQGFISYLNMFWFLPFFVLILRVWGGYRSPHTRLIRKKVRKLLNESQNRPIVICANHLTMIDSLIISWLLFSPASFFLEFRKFPWNVPEVKNFGKNFWLRVMCYLGKCIFIDRQGTAKDKKQTLAKIAHLTRQGQMVCIFPEGGRSREGRVIPENAVYGVGELIQEIPGCLALCIYVRGEHQEKFSYYPKKGESFYLDAHMMQPTSESTGRRGARDITMKIMNQLKVMEDSCYEHRLTKGS